MNSDLIFYNNLSGYTRRSSCEINIGNTPMGAKNPIRIQTMTSTKTTDTPESVEQIIRCIHAGSEYIRLAVPKPADVENLKQIKALLQKKGYQTPLVADVHFNAKLALQAAEIVDKVRINPGNYADKKRFKSIDYTPGEYTAELKRIEDALIPLIELCKKNKVAIRIGTNHGSLSDRIMSKYGDTPEGMSESSMEFLRLLKKHDFNNVVISMKASNTRIMVYATRLLVAQMNQEGMNYPIHLGVTEAGEGEDGRIKSAVGIGALLMDGIGDTIRVSLTEEPEAEIPVAHKIVDYITTKKRIDTSFLVKTYPCNPFEFNRHKTNKVAIVGAMQVPVILYSKAVKTVNGLSPDIISGKKTFRWAEVSSIENQDVENPIFMEAVVSELNSPTIQQLKDTPNAVLLLKSNQDNISGDIRSAISRLKSENCLTPVVLHLSYQENKLEDLQLKSSIDAGGLLIDGFVDGLFLENTGTISDEEVVNTAFSILQAARLRTSKTEYISCPSCGRTLFDIQQTTKEIRNKTSHLKDIKIGIMGCIVNGLGEMADADYGYVGAGPGKINLYKNKILIKKNLPQESAVNELIALIKEQGDWKEPA